MKLIVQIPCYYEAESIPQAITQIPREFPDVDAVENLVLEKTLERVHKLELGLHKHNDK